MPNNRFSLLGGAILILLGIIFLANVFLPGAWALVLAGIGVFFLVLSFLWRKADLATSGVVNIVLGGILFYQTRSGDWQSWYFLWPLLFSAVGAGLLLEIPLRRKKRWPRREDPPGQVILENDHPGQGRSRHALPGKFVRTALSFLILGLVAAIGLGLVRAWLEWPVILWGMGVFFILSAITSGVSPLVIPGAILGGIGGLLAYQSSSGDWASWAFAWALLPGFVGLGLFFAFLRSRAMRLIGLLMTAWSLVVATIFGLVFARGGQFASLWPVALVLAGLIILAQSFAKKPRSTR